MTGYAQNSQFEEARSAGTAPIFKPTDNMELLRPRRLRHYPTGCREYRTPEDLSAFKVKPWLLSEEGRTGIEEDDDQSESADGRPS